MGSYRLLSVLFAAATVVTIFSARYCFVHPEENDFASFYSGGRALRLGSLTDLYRGELHAPPQEPFVRPPAYALAMFPFSYLPFSAAFWTWIGLQLAGFGCCLLWAQDRIGWSAAISCFFPPVLLGISHGQDSGAILAAFVGAYALARKERHWWAGVVLGVALVKFHLLLLWPAALIVQRRWKMLAGFAAAAALLMLISLSLVGRNGIVLYAELIGSGKLSAVTPGPTHQFGISGLWANLGIGVGPMLYFAVVSLAAVSLRAVWRRGIDDLFLIGPAASLAIAPHVLYYDPALLLLPLWIAQLRWSPSGIRLFLYAFTASLAFVAGALPSPLSSLGSMGLLLAVFLGCTAAMRGCFERRSARLHDRSSSIEPSSVQPAPSTEAPRNR